MRRIVCSALLVCLLVAPAVAGQDHPELLLGFNTDFENQQIVIEVASSGCTVKQDFRAEYQDATLTFFRLRRDDCKAMPRKIPIRFSLEELELSAHQPFSLGNPIVVNENFAGQWLLP